LQIGFEKWAKEQKDHRDFKAEALAANEPAGELRRQGLAADFFISSVSALTKEGELYAVDLTGTR
jgi:hypothetical protein